MVVDPELTFVSPTTGLVPTFRGNPVSRGWVERLQTNCSSLLEADMLQRAYAGCEIDSLYMRKQNGKHT